MNLFGLEGYGLKEFQLSVALAAIGVGGCCAPKDGAVHGAGAFLWFGGAELEVLG